MAPRGVSAALVALALCLAAPCVLAMDDPSVGLKGVHDLSE